MDLLRLVAALAFGVFVYSLALGSVPVALGALGFIVVLAAGWMEVRLDRIGKAQDANFKMLRHLQRLPSGRAFDQD